MIHSLLTMRFLLNSEKRIIALNTQGIPLDCILLFFLNGTLKKTNKKVKSIKKIINISNNRFNNSLSPFNIKFCKSS